MIVEKRGSIDYDEAGHGPTVVLAPGSCSTGSAWRPVIAHLNGDFRCVTTSLLGYGGTRERRTGFDTDISAEAEILESVIRHAARPVHLVGHSFGGLAALAVALRREVPLLSLTIIEAPAAELLRNAGEYNHYRAFRDMTGAYFAAYYAEEAAAIETMIDFYGGAGTFSSWPERARAYAIEKTPVNVLDWADVYGFELTPSLLKRIDVPTLVILGETSHPAVRCANRLIGRNIPGASIVAIAEAAHFMINTHAGDVARAVARHACRAEILSKSIAA